MAGLFSNEGDVMSNIMQRRQQANQALGSPYGKYGGIVQAGGMFADVGADAAAGGGYGAADPRMQQQKELKQIAAVVAQQFPGKTDSPEFYKALALAVQDKYPQKAQEAMQMAVEKEKQGAEMRKARQEERDAQDVITGRVNILKSQGFSPDDAQRIARDETTYAQMIKPKEQPKKFNFGVERESEAAARYNQRFEDLTQKQQADINKVVADKAAALARSALPPAFGDVANILGEFNKLIEPDLKVYKTAESALTQLDEAKASNNASSYEAARTQFAKAVGEGKLSNEDVRRVGVDPAVWSRIKDTLSKAFTGVPTLDTQNQLRAGLNILMKTYGDRVNKEAARHQSVFEILRSGNLPTAEQIYPTVAVPTTGSASQPSRQQPRRRSFNDLPVE
jgi:hypothetical protein